MEIGGDESGGHCEDESFCRKINGVFEVRTTVEEIVGKDTTTGIKDTTIGTLLEVSGLKRECPKLFLGVIIDKIVSPKLVSRSTGRGRLMSDCRTLFEVEDFSRSTGRGRLMSDCGTLFEVDVETGGIARDKAAAAAAVSSRC